VEVNKIIFLVLWTGFMQISSVSVRKMEVEEIYLRAMNKSQQDLASVPPLQKRQQPYRFNIILLVYLVK
jgi:hypothetical protein